MQQLPPVLYQLLLLSATAGTRSTALLGLTKLFDHLERQPQNQQTAVGALGSMPSRTLLQIEATLLMHISTLLKYDSALGNEWLKWLKANISANQFLLQVGHALCSMASCKDAHVQRNLGYALLSVPEDSGRCVR